MGLVKKLRPIAKFLSYYFRPTYTGLENIPRQGPGLLVGNHGIMGFDAVFIFLAAYDATGRMPRGLGDIIYSLIRFCGPSLPGWGD